MGTGQRKPVAGATKDPGPEEQESAVSGARGPVGRDGASWEERPSNGQEPGLSHRSLGSVLALLPSMSLGFLMGDTGVITVPTSWDYGENS